MSRSPNQKLKLLYLMRFLLLRSDEEHPLSVADMIEMLEAEGIRAERKSLYDDLETLCRFGLDIERVRSKSVGYYIANRQFELPELKLLIDAVQAAHFITPKKSARLIDKITNMASGYQAAKLKRQVFTSGRVKSSNESILYTVDALHEAISSGKKLCFRYFEWTATKERRLRHGGKIYLVSPYAVCWEDDNYYLIARDDGDGMIKHFRADRMVSVELSLAPSDPPPARFDVSVYTRRVFGMFGGREQLVRMRFSNRLCGVVIDRFGEDVELIRCDSSHFEVAVPIAVSPKFFAWLLSFGSEAQIISPLPVAQRFCELCESALAAYSPERTESDPPDGEPPEL